MQIADSDFRFRFQIQVSDSDFRFRFQIQISDPGPAVGSNEAHSVSSNLLVNSAAEPCIEPSNKQQEAALLSPPRVPPTCVGLL
jgi:hypothetical protein